MDTFDNPIVTFDLEEQAPANAADDRTSGRSFRRQTFTREQLSKAFSSADDNNSGELDYEEVRDLLKSLGRPEAAARVKAEWYMLDVNGDGETGAYRSSSSAFFLCGLSLCDFDAATA